MNGSQKTGDLSTIVLVNMFKPLRICNRGSEGSLLARNGAAGRMREWVVGEGRVGSGVGRDDRDEVALRGDHDRLRLADGVVHHDLPGGRVRLQVARRQVRERARVPDDVGVRRAHHGRPLEQGVDRGARASVAPLVPRCHARHGEVARERRVPQHVEEEVLDDAGIFLQQIPHRLVVGLMGHGREVQLRDAHEAVLGTVPEDGLCASGRRAVETQAYLRVETPSDVPQFVADIRCLLVTELGERPLEVVVVGARLERVGVGVALEDGGQREDAGVHGLRCFPPILSRLRTRV